MESLFSLSISRSVFACQIIDPRAVQCRSPHLIEVFISSIFPHKFIRRLFFIDVKMMFRVLFPFCCFGFHEKSPNSACLSRGRFPWEKKKSSIHSVTVIRSNPISRHQVRLSRNLTEFLDGILSAMHTIHCFPTFSLSAGNSFGIGCFSRKVCHCHHFYR